MDANLGQLFYDRVAAMSSAEAQAALVEARALLTSCNAEGISAAVLRDAVLHLEARIATLAQQLTL